MREVIIEPENTAENIIVQFSDKAYIDKKLAVTVPRGFQAVVFVEEKIAFRIEPCVKKNIVKEYGKEYLNKECKIVFVRTKTLPQMAWGFGNINVNNARLNEAYRVGANGSYIVEITELSKLIGSFESDKEVVVEDIRDKTISILKNIGTDILGGYFAETNVSVFEIAAYTAEIRKVMFDRLKEETAFGRIGVKLKDITIDGIHINEDDLNLIRNRINNTIEITEEA